MRGFTDLVDGTRHDAPTLLPYLAAQPMKVLAHEQVWPLLVQTVQWIAERATPDTYLRQVDVPGVDTKFIERHRALLADLLDPKNPVVDDGRLAAVPDWGDMTAGDSAIDLAAAWMLFPVRAQANLWTTYGAISASTMDRAKGWAVFFGLTLLEAGLADDGPFEAIGRATLARLCTA